MKTMLILFSLYIDNVNDYGDGDNEADDGGDDGVGISNAIVDKDRAAMVMMIEKHDNINGDDGGDDDGASSNYDHDEDDDVNDNNDDDNADDDIDDSVWPNIMLLQTHASRSSSMSKTRIGYIRDLKCHHST